MDALPIEEKTGLEFQSRNKGVMHACGHDIHMTVGLGTAAVLSELRDRIKGTIKFIFQPAEEGLPGNEEGGASLMVKEGVLENPPVRAIFGLHVWPDSAGEVYFSEGPIMAGSASFQITVKGRNSHGARPHEGVDSIVLASEIVLALQAVVSRTTDPTDTAVLTIGKINGGTRSNVIADETVMEGTVRTHSESNRKRIPDLMESIVKGITSSMGGEYAFSYVSKLPAVSNDPELARLMLPTVKNILGDSKVHPVTPQFVSEDFSYYGQKIPGFFFFLGVNAPETKETYPLHSPRFSPDERSIPVGIRVMAHLLLDNMEHQRKSSHKPPLS
jgi:amidohydrolase